MLKNVKGFHLVELIVVAIIGILALSLSPTSLRCTKPSVPSSSNVKAIKEAEEIYSSENDGYLQVTAHPTTTPSKKARPGSGNSGFIT